ncbi:hypothetical protein WJX77_007936 [Trebouxia sp. C0004]
MALIGAGGHLGNDDVINDDAIGPRQLSGRHEVASLPDRTPCDAAYPVGSCVPGQRRQLPRPYQLLLILRLTSAAGNNAAVSTAAQHPSDHGHDHATTADSRDASLPLPKHAIVDVLQDLVAFTA